MADQDQVLGRDQILGADDLGVRSVPVPGWGGVVLMRGLTGKERDRFEADNARRAGNAGAAGQERALQNIRARLVVRCLVDKAGDRLFSDQDAEALGEKSGAILDRLFDVAAELSGITPANVEAMAADFGGGLSA